MRLIVATAVLLMVGGASAQGGPEIPPGRPPPREIKEKVRPFLDELRKALAEKDEKAAKEACDRIVEAMGPWAGNPEVAPRYYKPVERSKPDPEAVWNLWREIDRRTRRDALWVAAPDGDPKRMTKGLRAAGRPVIAYSVLFRLEADERKRKDCLRLVREGADYLLKLQRKDGLFPFPDLRGKHPRFGPLIEKLLRRKPEALVDGWIVDDLNGDLRYDNGICGVALVEAYEATKEKKYLEGARKACDWVVKRPLSTNWNYNAFSVWLLARYARAGGGKRYLDAALEILKIGVLPGQMRNGRWWDPHNARLVYHGIIVRGMLEAYRALDEAHGFRESLRDSLTRALDNAAAQIRKNGASSNSTTTEVLSRALMIFGPDERWEEALNINVNAGLHVMRDRRAPNVGIYLPHYIRYMERKKSPELLWTIDGLASTSLASAAVGDITGDGKPEVVFGTYKGDNTLYAVDGASGRILWKHAISPRGGCLDAAPALFDVDGDGRKDVLFASTMTREFFRLSGDGKVLWRYETDERRSLIDSACAVGDVNGDGKAEVLFGISGMLEGGKRGALYVLGAADGKLLWKKTFFGGCQCGPVLVDLTGDGTPEVVMALFMAGRRAHRRIVALSGKDGAELWSYVTGRPFQYHNVSVGDMTGDGKPELAVGASDRASGDVLLLSADGRLLWKFEADGMIPGPTAMADVDGDGRMELLFIDGRDRCCCLAHRDGKPSLLWKTATRKTSTDEAPPRMICRGPVIADVSGDGRLDVVFCTDHDRKVRALNGKDGSVLWEFVTAAPEGETRKYYPNTGIVVADLDGDGGMEVFFVAGGRFPDLYGRAFCLKTSGKGPAWPMFRRDLVHGGCVPAVRRRR